MNKETGPVFAINARVILDVTPTGKTKYKIEINHDIRAALGLIQRCHDYDQRIFGQLVKLDNHRVYNERDCYITFSICPRSQTSDYIITCKCDHSGLNQADALKLVKKGMELAFKQAES